MGYNTTGESHKLGLKAETIIQEQMENTPQLKKYLGGARNIERRGGTKHKEDIVFVDSKGEERGVSVKNRKGHTGTFDLINTSKMAKNISAAAPAAEYMKEVKGSGIGPKRDTLVVKKVRDKFKEVAKSCLDQMSGKDLLQILSATFEPYLKKDLLIAVCYREEGVSRWMRSADHPVISMIECNNTFFLKSGRGVTSTQIWARDSSGQEINTNLRLRLETNNGIGALLGGKRWSSNPTSSLVIKIQQDNPDSLWDVVKHETFSL